MDYHSAVSTEMYSESDTSAEGDPSVDISLVTPRGCEVSNNAITESSVDTQECMSFILCFPVLTYHIKQNAL